VQTLEQGGFLEGELLEQRRAERHRAFAEAARREPALAGEAYPAEPTELRQRLEGWLAGGAAADTPRRVCAIAAPHVSPEGGHRSYAAAYQALAVCAANGSAGAAGEETTFVVLGTSHYGAAERFGLTRKAYETPYGATRTDAGIVEALIDGAGGAAVVEDYCHAVEHSIEFQVLFLQHVFGPQVRVVPVLCGPFARATALGGWPEDDPEVRGMIEALRELPRRVPSLAWVLGVDLAHVGRRYGHDFEAQAGCGPLAEVERRDRQRLERVLAGDAHGFWALVRENGDELGWCGSSALYTFLRAAGPVRGELLCYEQWNIDPASVVSFAALAFEPAPIPALGEE
jgi:AmmeMemoRadiSam system protein B